METEVKSSSGEVLPEQFRFCYDAHHGWLEVPYSTICKLNLNKLISGSSFQSGQFVYLEEDLDAPMFIRSYLTQIDKPGDHRYFNKLCSTNYDGELSTIRSFPRYDQRLRKAFTQL